MCRNGVTAPIDDWVTCNLGLEPPRIIVSSATKSANALEELTHGLLQASALYSKRPDLFELFGNWDGMPNILFKVSTSILKLFVNFS